MARETAQPGGFMSCMLEFQTDLPNNTKNKSLLQNWGIFRTPTDSDQKFKKILTVRWSISI